MEKLYTLPQAADLLSMGKHVVQKWVRSGQLLPEKVSENGNPLFSADRLKSFDTEGHLRNSGEPIRCKPYKDYSVVELFAGAGGLALGLEKSGIKCAMLNELNKHACATLRKNRPNWNVIEGDVREVDFSPYKDKVDIVTGGFPCQSFSYAGKRLGFEDARGTLFFEFARAVKEIRPLICIGENVRGLLQHENGRTLEGMISILDELGYDVVPTQVLKAIFYRVPQKRERLIIVGLRRDANLKFRYPTPHKDLYTVGEALKKGRLYDCDVPHSEGQKYPKRKAEILAHVPQGGYWRDLPEDLQKEYMQASFYLGGGKTGMARRMSWDEPCLTLTCAPAQKQTERCHPLENRPFTVREYARIQTFPDNWEFCGSLSEQYKQIGNAVPVNLGEELGHTLIEALNYYYSPEKVEIPQMEYYMPLKAKQQQVKVKQQQLAFA